MTVLAAGQHIADRYQLDRRIAVGGMGEVWEASDTRLGRSVAVKVLRPSSPTTRSSCTGSASRRARSRRSTTRASRACTTTARTRAPAGGARRGW